MVYSPPRPRGLADILARRNAAHDAYHATVRTLPTAQREPIEAYVSALMAEAAARRVQARDEGRAR
ncbi:hypothetical protein [Microbacterium sp. GCS4]|uniref:hypothetical protein n=1 Tax=Microbacterium sp. GCS4 TaxID=1692239 RepID=UPI00068355BC|nr:hypothetical protein [Microbacterium sp. GCS4]KNY04775.1 hypothetical protein AKH00_14935 [Microbacterium sp. GCS4]